MADHTRLDADLAARARLHAALGEPVRLAMAEHLALTDASPGELGARYGLATNRLAYHLNVLEGAGVIRRVRSEGDARRAYVQLRLEDPHLAALLTAALRPQLPVPAGCDRVLFVCTHNSARSQLAAAAWTRLSQVPTASAGTDPAPRVHPRAISTGRRHGLKLGRARTAHLDQVAAGSDLIVCVCDNAYEELATASPSTSPSPSPSPSISPSTSTSPSLGPLHWAVPDPARTDTDEAFEAAYTQLSGRLHRLAAVLTP